MKAHDAVGDGTQQLQYSVQLEHDPCHPELPHLDLHRRFNKLLKAVSQRSTQVPSSLRKLFSGTLLFALLLQPTLAADLQQHYSAAQTNDPTFNAARAALAAGQTLGQQGLSALYPSVNFTAGLTRNFDKEVDTQALALTLRQPLFNAQAWYAYQQLKASERLAQAQFAQAEQDLILRVASAYFDVLTAQDNVATFSVQQEALAQQLNSVKRNFAVGLATAIDVQDVQARVDLVAAQRLAAQSELLIKQAALNNLSTSDSTNLARLKPKAAAPLPAEPLNYWLEAAQRQHPAVVAQQLALETSQASVQRNRAVDYPNLDLVGSSSDSRTAGINSRSNTLGLELRVPISAWWTNRAAVNQVAAQAEQARFNLQQAVLSASQSARSAYVGVVNGAEQVNALESALASSQAALASTQKGYEVGVRVNLDVLNAQQQVAQNRQSLSRARYELLQNYLRLKAAVGQLSAADVQTLNQLLLN